MKAVARCGVTMLDSARSPTRLLSPPPPLSGLTAFPIREEAQRQWQPLQLPRPAASLKELGSPLFSTIWETRKNKVAAIGLPFAQGCGARAQVWLHELAPVRYWKRAGGHGTRLKSMVKGRLVARSAQADDFEMEELEDFDTADMDEEADEDMLEDGLEFEEAEEVELADGSYSVRDSRAGEGDEVLWTEMEEVEHSIDEAQFHKIALHRCNFFIRKAPDKDDDVYDFQEMYVAAPDAEKYAIPKVKGSMPPKPLRCSRGEWRVLLTREVPISSEPRRPAAASMDQVAKVFLIKHHLNRRAGHPDFVLQLEEVYVLDSADRSVQRAPVTVDSPGGRKRNRKDDVLTVRDNGTTFRVIPKAERSTPDQVIEEQQWQKSRAALEAYLRGYRDYEKSNWF